MEAAQQMNYDLVLQRKEGPIFSYHAPKIPKVLNEIQYDFLKFKFPNRLKQKT